MTPLAPKHEENKLQEALPEETGVADVRRARESIARQHHGNLAEHVAESNRISDELRAKLRLGPVVQAPVRHQSKSGTDG